MFILIIYSTNVVGMTKYHVHPNMVIVRPTNLVIFFKE